MNCANFTTVGGPLPEVRFLSCPHHWREAADGESEEAFSARLADELDRTLRNNGPERFAGFFAEPSARCCASTASRSSPTR